MARGRRGSDESKFLARASKNLGRMHFSLACGEDSCILQLRTASAWRRERCSIRRTRVRIEFASGRVPFPLSPNNKKVHRQTHALASRGSDILYGVWRYLWHRRNHSWRGVWPRDPNSAVSTRVLEPANGVHDRGAVERVAGGGRLLCMGAARPGKLLGISGSLVVPGGKHF